MSTRRRSRKPFGWYCTECGSLYSSPGSGLITCQRCGHLGLRGFDGGPPTRITCTEPGCSWQGWDDGGVNDDRERHAREHAS